MKLRSRQTPITDVQKFILAKELLTYAVMVRQKNC